MLSKEVQFPTAIESLKGIVFAHNICRLAQKLYWWRYEVVNFLLPLRKQSSLKGYLYCLQEFSKAVCTWQPVWDSWYVYERRVGIKRLGIEQANFPPSASTCCERILQSTRRAFLKRPELFPCVFQQFSTRVEISARPFNLGLDSTRVVM